MDFLRKNGILYIFIPMLLCTFGAGFSHAQERPDAQSGEVIIPANEPYVIDESFIAGEEFIVEEFQTDEESLSGGETAAAESDDSSYLFVFEAQPITVEGAVLELRSLNNIFPDLSRTQRRNVMRAAGLRNSFEEGGSPILHPDPNSGIELYNSYVIQKSPSHIVEALAVVPYNNRELDMLDVYNALGLIQNLRNQTVPTRNDSQYQIFSETTRLESAQNRRPIPDPPSANYLPYSETMFLRFKDNAIGEMFLRGEINIGAYGITYSLTNFRDVYFSIFRVMRAERFSAIIYLEPITEGILVYSMSGIYLPAFIASRLNLTFNINNRITVITNWIIEGLRRQDNAVRQPTVPYAAN